MRFVYLAGWISLIFLIVLNPSRGFGEERYIKITSDSVNIREAPTTESTVVTRCRRGDIFLLAGEEGEWYRIRMFSDQVRYVFKQLAERTVYVATAPSEEGVLKGIIAAVQQAEERALHEAAQESFGDIDKNIAYDSLLNDRYKLRAFHRYRLSPASYGKILEYGLAKNAH